MPRRRVALAVAGVATVLALLAVPAPASAHDSLTGADPADGATVEQLDAVTLSYSGTLLSIGEDQRSAAIQVSRDGRYYELGCPRLVDNTASVDVALGDAGEYDVLWQVVSSDGHTISGEYSFEYAPTSDAAAPSDGSETPACGGEDEGEAAGPSDDTILIGAAAGIGALALVGVVVAVILGRRRGPGTDDTDDDEPERPAEH